MHVHLGERRARPQWTAIDARARSRYAGDVPSPVDVTRLLAECDQGGQKAIERVFPIVYAELRALAARHLDRERRDHTLQPTALVHEAFLKLVDQENQRWQNRAHFFGIAATAMRRILVRHAEARAAAKRGGDRRRTQLFEAESPFEEPAEDLIALDSALVRLHAIDPRKARLVDLRYFAGLSEEEAAEALGVSVRTVERDWRLAKAWLRKEIGEA
jgi:RNA polymerase sigma factor (TIGR02999 family)